MTADNTGLARGSSADAVAPITLQYFAPPAELQPLITTLYSLRSPLPRISDVLPAAVGYVLLFLSGEGEIEFADGRREPSHPAALLTPTTTAVQTHVRGPFHIIGAALSPLGWAAITALPADAWQDRFLDAGEALGPDWRDLAGDLRAHETAASHDPQALLDIATAFIAARLKPVNGRHAALIGHVTEWLSSDFDPPLAALEERCAYSGRQLQRLVERYFGARPKQLVRKYRALRVAALLQAPDTGEDRIAELMNLFYDQSHMIREVREFLGRTPARLGDGGSPLLDAVSSVRNYREVKPNLARMPKR